MLISMWHSLCDLNLTISAVMNFGDSDEILETAEHISATTVTWRWKEAQKPGLMANDAAPYIGFIIKYSVDENTWHDSNRIPFQATEDLWQEGRVTGLQPDTQYWFDIVVYRIYTGDILYISTNTAKGVIGKYLTARTTPGTGVTRKYNIRNIKVNNPNLNVTRFINRKPCVR